MEHRTYETLIALQCITERFDCQFDKVIFILEVAGLLFRQGFCLALVCETFCVVELGTGLVNLDCLVEIGVSFLPFTFVKMHVTPIEVILSICAINRSNCLVIVFNGLLI